MPSLLRKMDDALPAPLLAHDTFLSENPSAAWVQALRKLGAAEFAKTGLPTKKWERWKYTDLPAAVRGFGDKLSPTDVVYKDPDNLVRRFVDVYAEGAPQWLIDLQSSAPPNSDMALWHLCNAYLRDGLMADIPAGNSVDNPVEVVMTGHDGAFFVPRTAFRLGEGAQFTLIEHHKGDGRFWNNRLTQVIVGKGATMRHYRIQDYSTDAVYTQNLSVKIEAGGTYEACTLGMGCHLRRNQIHAVLAGEGASCNLFGINLLRGDQHGDTTITVEHAVPNCTSRQEMRSIVADRAHGVFQGKILVRPDAIKTDGYQMSRALLMSEGAEMDTKPELEIYADDVKCSHGATTGQVDDEALFYLRSRGVPLDQARMLLVSAFVDELVDKLGNEGVKTLMRERVASWMAR